MSENHNRTFTLVPILERMRDQKDFEEDNRAFSVYEMLLVREYDYFLGCGFKPAEAITAARGRAQALLIAMGEDENLDWIPEAKNDEKDDEKQPDSASEREADS